MKERSLRESNRYDSAEGSLKHSK